jgi:O-antigen/teichoic acid export membrane protein
MLAKGISILCTFAQVPIAVRFLGSEAYGFWIALLSLALLMNFADLGLGVGLQNTLATAFARNDVDRMRSAYATGLVSLGLLTLAVLVISVPAILIGDWARVFHLTQPALIVQSRPALLIVVGLFALGLPLNATARLVAAVQTGWIHAFWIAAGSVFSLVLVFFAARADVSFTTFLALACLGPLLQGIGMHLHMMHRLRWKHRRTPLLPAEERRVLLRTSFLFSAPQIGLALIQTMPPIALATTAGPIAAGAYNILYRLLSPLHHGQHLFLAPLWPAFTEANVRGDRGWILRGLRLGLLATAGFALVLVAVAGVSDPLIHGWIGAKAPAIAPSLKVSTVIWLVTLMAGQPLLFFLLGMEKLHGLATYGTFGYMIAILGMFVGGYLANAPGVLIGGALGYGVFVIGGMIRESLELARGLHQNQS